MTTLSHANVFHVTGPLWGEPPVTGGFPSQRPVRQSFDFFIHVWTNGWANNRDAGDLRRHHVHHGVTVMLTCQRKVSHDDVIKCKLFPRYWPFVRGIHRSPVNSPHKGQWRRALMFSLICVRINGWINNREAGDLRRHKAHCDVIVMDTDMGRKT